MSLLASHSSERYLREQEREGERENPDENEKTMDSQTLLVEVDIINTLEGILN